MTDFSSPVGRLVQGSPIMEHQKDMDTNQPLYEDGKPVMGIFMALAFPKVFPANHPQAGQRNSEFDQFFSVLAQTAAAAWPALFPQGAPAYVEYTKPGMQGASTHPRFSWKYQDGDGVSPTGKDVSGKPGFKGHHIIKFFTSFPVRCFHEGKFAPHEELPTPAEVIKRGYWLRIIGETKSNMATGTQVPGISIYPKLVSFVGRGSDGEIVSGPDAQEAFGKAAIGWRPEESSVIPTGGAPVPTPSVSVPTPGVPTPGASVAVPVPSVAVPTPGVQVPVPSVAVPVPTPTPPAGPQVNAQLAASNITWANLQAQGWTEETARAAGHII